MRAAYLTNGEWFRYGEMLAERWDSDPNKLPNMVSCLTGHHVTIENRRIFYIPKDAEVRLSGPWKKFADVEEGEKFYYGGDLYIKLYSRGLNQAFNTQSRKQFHVLDDEEVLMEE